THRLEQIERRRIFGEPREQLLGGLRLRRRRRQLGPHVHSTALVPSRGAHVITSPRVSDESTVCAKLFMETCRAKYWCSTEPSRIALPPSNERSSTVTRISRPRLKAIGPDTGWRRTTGLTPIERTPSI